MKSPFFNKTVLPATDILQNRQEMASDWFRSLRDQICQSFETIENADSEKNAHLSPGRFSYSDWARDGGGGGTIGLMKGRVFEKVGVNISTVHGTFSEEFRERIPGAEEDGTFWASGISLVAHMHSPHVPAVHMNTRMIVTQKSWFGGGADLTPVFPDAAQTQVFHSAFEQACHTHSPEYYPCFKNWCDEYFYLPHRQEARGVGGIFYDNLDTGNWHNDFAFTQDVGRAFLSVYPKIVTQTMSLDWNDAQRQALRRKRGRYVEFNLLYDRGTTFGLKTGGNVDAILMSMPPDVAWE